MKKVFITSGPGIYCGSYHMKSHDLAGLRIMLTCQFRYLKPLEPNFKISKQGYTLFFEFYLIHRLWVLVKTASVRWFLRARGPTIYVKSKN